MIGPDSVSSMDIGDGQGWSVWPLENGDWGWNAFAGANGRSGIEASEAEAEMAAQRELEHMVSEAAAAEQSRRELPVREDLAKQWDPQS
jgi:hypothetical protein